MIKRSMAIALFGALAACSSPEEVAEEVTLSSAAMAQAAPAQPVLAQGGQGASGRAIAVDNDAMEFRYSWPTKANSIEPLAALLEQRAEEVRETFGADAAAAKADAEQYGYPFRPYSRQTEWQVVTDTPRFLSLSAENYFYTGGAHGNSDFDALVWDKEASEAMAPADLFASMARLDIAIRETYCERLKAARTERIGQELAEPGEDIFASCPPMEDLVLIVGSSDGQSMDRLGLLAAPYVAGSFAEGPYDVTVPVTQAVMDAVKSEYRGAFAIGG